MFDIKLSKFKSVALLLTIFIIGLILRLIYFNRITFGYDQARDAFMAIEIIAKHHIKILGPATDIPGLYHGTLYWYLIGPIYYLTQGNVFAVRFLLILINLSGIFPLFFITKKISKNNFVALFSVFLYSISFEMIQYSRWLSNPAPALISSLITYYSLWMILNKDFRGIYVFLIFWPISVQFEFFFVYHIFLFIGVLLFVLYKTKIEVNLKRLILSGLISACIFSTFIVSELRFRFQGIHALIGFFQEDKTVVRSFMANFISFADKLVNSFYFNISGINLFLAGVIFMACLCIISREIKNQKKYKETFLFLFFWLLSPGILFMFEKLGASFVTMGISYATIIISSMVLALLLQRFKYKTTLIIFAILFVFAGNLMLNISQSKKGEVLFSVQDKMLLSDELTAIDWIYQQSRGQKYSIDTVTNPLFINTTWSYLFNWYGKSKYGYMPIWSGEYQPDVLGGDPRVGRVNIQVEFSQNISQTGMANYLIIEPETGIPKEYINAYEAFENKRSTLVEKKKFGNFVVEKRIFNNETPFSRDVIYHIAKELISHE